MPQGVARSALPDLGLLGAPRHRSLLASQRARDKGSFPLALGFLCASAASAAVPIGPAGAAMQAGAGATLLALSGVPKAEAVAFAVAAQALVVVTGAAVMLLVAAWQVGDARQRPRLAAAI